MGLKKILFAGLAAFIAYQVFVAFQPHTLPKIDYNFNWGDESKSATDEGIKPFKIKIDQTRIDELIKDLARPRYLQPPLKGVGFTYGFDSNTAQKIIKYWREDYLTKWTEREAFLNSYPQFTTKVQGLNMHFIHIKAEKAAGKPVIPLILLHGWPGSVREFYGLIPKLKEVSKTKDYAFDIVVPSLPGYGWSEGTSKPGLASTEIGVIMRNLMVKLGYNRFVVQGGDWGAMIGAAMATLFPENVIGYHSNMCVTSFSGLSQIKSFIASFAPNFFVDPKYQDFHFPMKEKFMFIIEETGYMHIQATKPDTIGTALLQNPVGLAVYILEKFSTWTNPNKRTRSDGGLTEDFTYDAMLDNVMIYYLSNSITTSMRLYAENFSKRHTEMGIDRVPTKVPVGCARYKHDLAATLDWVLKDRFPNLIHSKYYEDGGHFAAMQLPQEFYNDFILYIDTLRTPIKST